MPTRTLRVAILASVCTLATWVGPLSDTAAAQTTSESGARAVEAEPALVFVDLTLWPRRDLACWS